MKQRRAITLIESIVVVVSVLIVAAVLVPVLGQQRCGSRQLRDSTQVRAIQQALVNCHTGPDQYVRPSHFDRGNATVAAGAAKDLPRHIFSILIYDGLISPEVCVSPAEANPDIRPCEGYQFDNPSGAIDPKMALWDPAFKATPMDGDIGGKTSRVGNLSYAIVPPVGARIPMWSNSFVATEAIVGNRGPSYRGGGIDQRRPGIPLAPWTLLPNTPTGTSPGGIGSNTLLIHGSRHAWEGNIAYNDGHIAFETDAGQQLLAPRINRLAFDNLFVNENDQSGLPDSETLEGAAGQNTNNFLRLWHDATVVDGKTTAIKPWYD